LSNLVPNGCGILLTIIEEVFHSFRLVASFAVRCILFSRFEGFIGCPDCSIEDLKSYFSGFGGEEGMVYGFKCFFIRFRGWIVDPVCSPGVVGWSNSDFFVNSCHYLSSIMLTYVFPPLSSSPPDA